jgi:U4/U6 small nuclear ribonucleoprotein PRP31
MAAKIEKWQEPPPAKTSKPLPAPDAEIKKRRGGRRLRKMKERYGLTDVSRGGASNQSNMAACTFLFRCVSWLWPYGCCEG